MKLYRVTVEHTFFMVAENDDEAARESKYAAYDAVRNDELELITEQEVTSLDQIPEEWRNSYPYGEDDEDRFCKDYVPAQGENEVTKGEGHA